MHPKTLLAIKTEIRKFLLRYHVELHHSINQQVFHIISNMAFNGSKCHGYDHNKAVEELKKNGVTIVDKIETYDYGKFVHILDAEGVKIQLWEPVD